MAISHRKSTRKATGGRYKTKGRKQKQFELGKQPALTTIQARRAKSVRTLGGHKKVRVMSTEVANVLDPKTKKYTKTKITNVAENEANRHYIRRNIITKGAVIETEAGKAKVTSRPGQSGTVNAVLI